jgi:16S rRNA (adenine1518-N6/adenine1519-N6)-dimethyltransferase
MKKRVRKRFGQHFLTDEGVLERIAAAIGIEASDAMVEIGPGQGALTQYLLPLVKHLDVIEIDRDLVAWLKQQYKEEPRLTIHQADVLQFDWQTLFTASPKRIVGNLPYNITTPLLFQLLGYGAKIRDMHFLLQKEVVDRLTADVGSPEYGRLTVMAQYYAQLTPLFTVSADSFSPPPQVESAFIRITPYPQLPYLAKDLTVFQQVVKEAFNYRRKTLSNSLRKFLTEETLRRLDIDPQWRPQQITVENFVKISNSVSILRIGKADCSE